MSLVKPTIFHEALLKVGGALTCVVFTLNASFFTADAQTSEQENQAQRELEATASAIEDIRAFLATANENQSQEEEALRSADAELARLSGLTAQTQTETTTIRAELAALQSQSQQLKNKKATQIDTVSKLLRAAYMQQQPGFLKRVFEAENLNKLQRTLHYTKKLSEYQLQKVAEFESTLTQLATAENAVSEKLNQLNAKDAELLDQLAALEFARSEKQSALNSLRSSIASKGQELNQLEANQAELQQLIEQIRIAMEGISSFADVPPFDDSRGRLAPPVRGRVSSGFGQTYGDGNLQRQGMILSAETGTAVRTVHPGQVVFADWLRGSGLLLIVDHGDGYMSLYGNNEALSASAGDWVDAGDTLATSGTSLSTGEAGLYFEIRHHGQPQDPAPWLNLGR